MAFPLPLLGTAVSGAIGLGQFVGGLFGKKRKQPKMSVPASIKEATQTSKNLASVTMAPGTEQAISNVRRTTDRSISNVKAGAKNAADVISAAGRANTNENISMQNISTQNQNFRMNAQNTMIGQLNRQGAYEQEAFMQNEMNPYMQEQQTRASLMGAGMQNVVNAGSDAVSISMLNDMMGNDPIQLGRTKLSRRRRREILANPPSPQGIRNGIIPL